MTERELHEGIKKIQNKYSNILFEYEEEIDTYCRVVDAVEMKLGTNKGDSIKTCEMVLDGKINASGINVSKYEDHKVLSVNYREKDFDQIFKE